MNIGMLKSPISDEGTMTDLPDFPGVRVSVRTTDHPDYQGYIARAIEREQAGSRNGKVEPKVRDEIVAKATAKHLLMDWEGVTSESGEVLPFDRKLVTGWAEDLKNYGRFFDRVLSASVKVTNRIAQEREDLGND
ncbi:MAG TPA: hypothetical protein VFD92_04630 [Candidatus Binatia bacterium]|nr:hypothetical protein [Candidatus Binatia bacterium]